MRARRRQLWLLLVALGGCGPSLPFAPAGPGAAPDPSAPGPFPVGVRTLELFDTTHKSADGSPRRLLTEVWYPAAEGARGDAGATYDTAQLFTPEQLAGTAAGALPVLQTSAVRDAPLAREHGPFPLVLFSHGLSALRWQSTYFTVALASHGYVVAAPDHTGGTFSDTVAEALAPIGEQLEDRPRDLSYLAGRLQRLGEADPLTGALDGRRVGVAGHSFGALTSLRWAALDGRARAVVAQSPPSIELAWAGLPAPVSLSIPVQLQSGRMDQTTPWEEDVVPTWAALAPPRAMLEVRRGGHLTPSILCGLELGEAVLGLGVPGVTDAVSRVLQDGCGPEFIPVAQAHPLLNHFAVGFFNAVLRESGQSWALLSQAQADQVAPGEAAFSLER
jgi:dienelactone hydrolase